jgi:hypothetical protein
MTGLTLYKVARQADVQKAERRAERLWPAVNGRKPGFRTAYLKGWRARRAGRGPGACPYTLGSGGGTWTWAWRSAWFQGWYEGATA